MMDTMARGGAEVVAVVLAAGLGSRLSGDASGNATPKPTRSLAGRTLLERTLAALRTWGASRAVVVVGHEADRVRRAAMEGAPAGLLVETVLNPRFTLQNGVSVLAARPRVAGRFLLTMADHVVDPAIVRLAAASDPGPDGVVLCVDRKLDQILDMADATKVRTRQGRIERIGKDLEAFDAVDTGVFHCSAELFEALAEIRSRQGDCSLSDGIGAMAARGRAWVVDIGGLEWQDVDTSADLAHAEKLLARWSSRK